MLWLDASITTQSCTHHWHRCIEARERRPGHQLRSPEPAVPARIPDDQGCGAVGDRAVGGVIRHNPCGGFTVVMHCVAGAGEARMAPQVGQPAAQLQCMQPTRRALELALRMQRQGTCTWKGQASACSAQRLTLVRLQASHRLEPHGPLLSFQQGDAGCWCLQKSGAVPAQGAVGGRRAAARCGAGSRR